MVELTDEAKARLIAQGVAAAIFTQPSYLPIPPERYVKLEERAEAVLRQCGIPSDLITAIRQDWDGGLSGTVYPTDPPPEHFDRTTYMREYMRARRAAARTEA